MKTQMMAELPLLTKLIILVCLWGYIFNYFNSMTMQMADTNGSSSVLIQVTKSMLVHLCLWTMYLSL